MLNKITYNRIFMVFILLIIPIMLSAGGNKEKGITLDEDVITLLGKVESGTVSLDEAKSEFESFKDEYQISSKESQQIQDMIKDVESGAKKTEELKEQIRNQFRTRQKKQDKIQKKDQTNTSTSG